MPRSILMVLALAAAACGRQQSADAPSGGGERIAVRTANDPDVVAATGGDTATIPGAPTTPAPLSPSSSVEPGAPPLPPPGAQAPAGQAPAGRQDANAILRRVETTAAGIRTFEADFTQSLRVPLLNSNQSSSGKLYQRKPDRFLMRFTEPAGDVMVADGRYFWIYYPSSDRTQVIRTSIAEGGEQADFQRQFLSNATDRFVATLNGQEDVAGEGTWALTLVPKRASPYKVVRIWVDRDDYMVRRFEMTEENNSVRRVELRNLKVNQPISDALFTFTPPAGTHVFEQ